MTTLTGQENLPGNIPTFHPPIKNKITSPPVIIKEIREKLIQDSLKLTIRFSLTPIGYGLCDYLKMNIYFDEKRIKTFYTTIPKRLKNLRKEHQVQILLKIGHINPGLYQAKISIEGIQVPNKILGQPAVAQTPIKIEKAQIRTTARRKIIVEKIKGETGISIVTPNIKQIYKEMEERRKREIKAWREGW